jgi:hypothetical protein
VVPLDEKGYLMFGLRRRRYQEMWNDTHADWILREEDKGQILNRLPDDAARYRACVRWAEEARDTFYRERRQTIAAIIMSRSIRYRQYSPEARAKIGDRVWGLSVRAKEIIGLEQMYGRWAAVYKAGPESR